MNLCWFKHFCVLLHMICFSKIENCSKIAKPKRMIINRLDAQVLELNTTIVILYKDSY